jgi:hypothetical protein
MPICLSRRKVLTLSVLAPIRRSPARRRAVETIGLVLSVIVLTAGLVVVLVRPVTATQFATLRPLEGTVEVAAGGNGFDGGEDGATLRAGDVIRTGPDGVAEIEFFDGSVSRLDHDTTLTLDRVANIPKAADSRLIEMDLHRGRTFHTVSNVSDPQSEFTIATGGIAATSAGSSFLFTALPIGGAALWVVPDSDPGLGVVEIDAEGTGVGVQEGQGTTVSGAGSAGTPFSLTEDHLTDPWVTYNLCELGQADLEPCREAAEVATPKPLPQPEPETDVLSKTVAPVAPFLVPSEAPSVTVPARVVLLRSTRGVSDAGQALFRFGSPDPFQYFECSLDGGSFRRCASPERFRGLSDGTHLFLVRAVDPAGDPGPVTRRRWRIDTVAPETLITGPSLASGGSQALFIFASTEPRSAYRCALDAGPFLTCVPPTKYAGLGPGTHTFHVRAVDRAGNVDPTPATYSWTVGEVVVAPVPLVAGGNEPTVFPGSQGGTSAWNPPNAPREGDGGSGNQQEKGSPVTQVVAAITTIETVVGSAANEAAAEVSSVLPPVEGEVIGQTAGDGGLVSLPIGT